MAALECLRDIGLEDECIAVAADGENMIHTRWCYSMAGEEYARVYSWGHDPARKGEYESVSPCSHIDLPQTALEPILIRRATSTGWKVRFSTSLIRFERPSPDVIISTVQDKLTGSTYRIQSKYLFGCDGARSQVVKELQLPFLEKPGQGFALNVFVRADLSHLMANRKGNLHWVFQPDKEYPLWGWTTIVRMVKPWTEWMFIFLPFPGANATAQDMKATNEEYLVRVRETIGDDSVDVTLLDVSLWAINESVARHYSDGNVFCLGDAVHRHPPFNGLGSNTCIQDAFNLAWKVSYVMSGKAGAALLDTFSLERQPVGALVISRANEGLRDHTKWMESIGMLEPSVERRREILAEIDGCGPFGTERRNRFQLGIANTESEFHGLGAEMNQTYTGSGVDLSSEPGPFRAPESILSYAVSTHPGRRLPHAWLNTRTPGKKLSTIDLAGHGRFCMLIGPGGSPWRYATKAVSAKLDVDIACYSIGWKQDYEDPYFDWARKSEVYENGCVLVRPDRFVAWRVPVVTWDPYGSLESAMRSVLSRSE